MTCALKNFHTAAWGLPIVALLGLAIAMGVAWADPAEEAPEPRFPIRAVTLEGASLIPQADIDAAVAPLLGAQRSFADLQGVVSAIEGLYARRGYRVIRVVLPEQDSSDGVFHVRVTEAKLGRVSVEGNRYHDEANLRASVPALIEGTVPNMARVDRALALANENGSKQTGVTLRSVGARDEVEALIKVHDESPLRGAVSLDNTGTSQTGRYRTGLALQHANLFDRDQALSAQFVTAPERPGDVQILGLSYRIPLYALGDALEFGYSYSSVNSGLVNSQAGNYAVSGSGTNWLISYVHKLASLEDWHQQLALSLEQHNFRSQVLFGGTGPSLVPDLSSRPVSLTYSGQISRGATQAQGSLGLERNLPGNPRNTDGQYALARQDPSGVGASSAFTILRWGVEVTRALPGDWAAHLASSGSYTRDQLISGEQFGLGGVASVRGFDERALADDYGLRNSLELRGPDVGTRFGMDRLSLRPHLFWDSGHLWRNGTRPGEQGSLSIGSIGLGFRGNYSRSLSLALDVGWAIDPGGTQQRGDARGHFSLSWQF